jgi:glycosyltransferase involved in cell wall biosynthesis
MDAMSAARTPLIVHFHGIDAHSRSILDRYGERYPRLFEQAAAIIANSRPMEQALLELGARPEKTHYVPNGVDADRFRAGAPAEASPTFLSVAEKKGPQLTIAETVTFLGAQPHEVVAEEMRRARAFVQHSVVASDGTTRPCPTRFSRPAQVAYRWWPRATPAFLRSSSMGRLLPGRGTRRRSHGPADGAARSGT